MRWCPKHQTMVPGTCPDCDASPTSSGKKAYRVVARASVKIDLVLEADDDREAIDIAKVLDQGWELVTEPDGESYSLKNIEILEVEEISQ